MYTVFLNGWKGCIPQHTVQGDVNHNSYVHHPYNFIPGVSTVSEHETVKLYISPKPGLLVLHVWIIYGVRQPPVYSSQPVNGHHEHQSVNTPTPPHSPHTLVRTSSPNFSSSFFLSLSLLYAAMNCATPSWRTLSAYFLDSSHDRGRPTVNSPMVQSGWWQTLLWLHLAAPSLIGTFRTSLNTTERGLSVHESENH